LIIDHHHLHQKQKAIHLEKMSFEGERRRKEKEERDEWKKIGVKFEDSVKIED